MGRYDAGETVYFFPTAEGPLFGSNVTDFNFEMIRLRS